MKRIFVFQSHPVQYHAPVYREVHRLCQERGGGSIHVFYATDVTLRGHLDSGFGATVAWDEPLLAGYPATVLNVENGAPLQGFHSLSGKGIVSLLRRKRPDAVILTALAYRFDWTVYLSALCLGIPIWIRTETQDEAFSRGRFKSLARSFFYRLVYAPVSKGLVIGRLNAEHYRRCGLSSARHIPSPYCVVDRFENITAAQASTWRQQVRRESGFDEQVTVLLFCGKLQTKKNPQVLLKALEKLPIQERKRFGVLYVGSGELDTRLRLKARALAGTRVCFAGFKNQTELAPYYLASDVLVLPSLQMGETWGLVVNEALLAGCKAIISRHVGCHADLAAAPGVSVFDGSPDGLLQALRKATAPHSQAAQRMFMQQYSVRAAAEGFAAAMDLPPAARERSFPANHGQTQPLEVAGKTRF